MDLSHEFTVPASVEETWAALNDIASVAECFPGAQVTEVDGDTFKGTVKVKLGPIALVYNGTGTFVEKDEATRTMTIAAKGKDKRGNGTAGADVVATMSEADGSTRVQVVTQLAVTGKPAQFGRGVMQDVSDKLLGQFTDCLAGRVGQQAPPDPEPAAAPDPAPSAAAADRPAPTAAAPPRPTVVPPRAESPDDALDLGATVLPVLARAYWKQALGGALALAVVVRLVRRLTRS